MRFVIGSITIDHIHSQYVLTLIKCLNLEIENSTLASNYRCDKQNKQGRKIMNQQI